MFFSNRFVLYVLIGVVFCAFEASLWWGALSWHGFNAWFYSLSIALFSFFIFLLLRVLLIEFRRGGVSFENKF